MKTKGWIIVGKHICFERRKINKHVSTAYIYDYYYCLLCLCILVRIWLSSIHFVCERFYLSLSCFFNFCAWLPNKNSHLLVLRFIEYSTSLWCTECFNLFSLNPDSFFFRARCSLYAVILLAGNVSVLRVFAVADAVAIASWTMVGFTVFAKRLMCVRSCVSLCFNVVLHLTLYYDDKKVTFPHEKKKKQDAVVAYEKCRRKLLMQSEWLSAEAWDCLIGKCPQKKPS